MGKGAPGGSGPQGDTLGREVFFARTSVTHDGVEVPGRVGALLGTIAILCFVPAFMIDDMVVLVDVRTDLTGLAERTDIHLGGWQHCWKLPVDTFDCEKKRVCFDYADEIRTNGTVCVSAAASAAAGGSDGDGGDAGSGSGSGVDGDEASTSAAPAVAGGRVGKVCSLLGEGDVWCDFLRYAVQAFNFLAILSGLVGDVLSDKVYATKFCNRLMGHFALVSVALMWWVPWIIYRPSTAVVCLPGVSCYFVIAGCALAHLGAHFSSLDIEYYPNTRRFGVQNDGLGACQRVGAVCGFLAWATLAMAVCSHRWSETHHLGSNPSNGLDDAYDAIAFKEASLGVVQHASWGLLRYCLEVPVAALGGDLGSVCLQYAEDFTVVSDGGWTNTTDGCNVFRNEPDYDLCRTIQVVLALSIGAVVVGVVGDVFSEKVLVNVMALGLFALAAASAMGVWLAFNESISGPTRYGAADQVHPGVGFFLCVASVGFAAAGAVAFFLDYKMICWKWVETSLDDEDDEDEEDGQLGHLFDCCECIEYTCYGDDLGPAAELLVKRGPAAQPPPAATSAVVEKQVRPAAASDGDAGAGGAAGGGGGAAGRKEEKDPRRAGSRDASSRTGSDDDAAPAAEGEGRGGRKARRSKKSRDAGKSESTPDGGGSKA